MITWIVGGVLIPTGLAGATMSSFLQQFTLGILNSDSVGTCIARGVAAAFITGGIGKLAGDDVDNLFFALLEFDSQAAVDAFAAL